MRVSVSAHLVVEDRRFSRELQDYVLVNNFTKYLNDTAIPRLESYETPLSAAKPRALAIASAMLTEPELTGLMELRSTLPEITGCGNGYVDDPTVGAEDA